MVLFIEAYNEIPFVQNRPSIETSIHISFFSVFFITPLYKNARNPLSFIQSGYTKRHLDQRVILLQIVQILSCDNKNGVPETWQYETLAKKRWLFFIKLYCPSCTIQGKTLYIYLQRIKSSLLICVIFPGMNWHVAMAGIESCQRKLRRDV